MTHKVGIWRKKGLLYVRVRGVSKRIYAEPGTPEFDREYWQIVKGTTQKASRTTWAALIASYQKSARWSGLKDRTRQDYQHVLDYLLKKAGSVDMTTTKRSDVIAAQDANRHRIRFANYIPQVMSVLCEHAIDIGWIEQNPAKGVRKIATPEAAKKEHIPWPDWAVERWRAEASEWHRLVFEIGVGTVQRPSDWLQFRWSDYDGEALQIVQGKTDVALWLPCTDTLRSALDAAKGKARGLTIIGDRHGRALTYDALSRRMYDERKRLDLLDYDLHALRYRGVRELALAGCTDDEICAYSGHASREMVRLYAGQARQRTRAKEAKEKRR